MSAKKARIVQLNSVSYGSTGNIMKGLALVASEEGYAAYSVCPYSPQNAKSQNDVLMLGHYVERSVQRKVNKVVGAYATGFPLATRRLLHMLDELAPDVLHLHNLHHQFCDLKKLFDYIKNKNIPVVWTLHDCWTFTGHCAHFTLSGCEKWKTRCYDCPSIREYPATWRDRSEGLYKLKREWFTHVPNLTIVTPSQWLAGLVAQSFLAEYPVEVIPNGIDLQKFKPTPGDFRQRHCMEEKFIVLGVAMPWSRRKGLDDFLKLADLMDERTQIILVGPFEKEKPELPANVFHIPRTDDQKQLAEIYSAADVLFNPTLEDNFPTVNLEALACGTPVVTYPTGGSPESINAENGVCLTQSSVEEALEVLQKMRARKIVFSPQACRTRALAFDRKARFSEYVGLYGSLLANL